MNSTTPVASPTEAAHAVPPRFNIYALIHKGLRAHLTHTLVAVGAMDVDDAEDVHAVLSDVRALLALLTGHIRHENGFVHPAMEARRAGSAVHTADDHVEHRMEIDAIGALVAAVEEAAGIDRQRAADRLYRRLALFVAENFVHMHTEETDNNAVLWAEYADDELLAIDRAIVASLPPDEVAVVMRWFGIGMNHGERVQMLSEIRAAAPAPVFAGLVGLMGTQLAARDREKLARALAQS